jgi:hypothetical protein
MLRELGIFGFVGLLSFSWGAARGGDTNLDENIYNPTFKLSNMALGKYAADCLEY